MSMAQGFWAIRPRICATPCDFDYCSQLPEITQLRQAGRRAEAVDEQGLVDRHLAGAGGGVDLQLRVGIDGRGVRRAGSLRVADWLTFHSAPAKRLLRVLSAPPDARADLIRQMYERPEARDLAEALMDLEAEPDMRLGVMEALKAHRSKP